MLDTLLERVLKEWKIITQAPLSFLVSVSLLAVLIFFSLEYFHAERDRTQTEHINLLTARLDESLKAKTLGDGNHFVNWPDKYQPLAVVGKSFKNEQVPLDGYAYSNCHFSNVTFLYNGTTPLQFTHNEMSGLSVLKTDNPAVAGTIYWVAGFVGLPDTVKLDIPAERLQRGIPDSR